MLWELDKKGEGIKQNTQRDNSIVIARGKGGLEDVEKDIEGINGDGRRLDLGW